MLSAMPFARDPKAPRWFTLMLAGALATLSGAGAVGVAGLAGCGTSADASAPAPTEVAAASPESEVVTPPFAVRGDAERLVLTWFDREGVHSAPTRHDIPEDRRAEVLVDSLEIPPDQRDADHVFVADLRATREDGSYVVRRLTRERFDALVDGARAAAEEAEAVVASNDPVVVFGASWCGACRQAEAYLHSHDIPYVEHDIEREPGARADMQRRARAAGIQATGIPVIDVHGRVMQGFDPQAIERALRETAPAAPAPSAAPPSPGVSI